MEWWVIGIVFVGGLIVLGAALAMRTRRDRGAGTEGPDLWEDDASRDARRRRDDPEIREWDGPSR